MVFHRWLMFLENSFPWSTNFLSMYTKGLSFIVVWTVIQMHPVMHPKSNLQLLYSTWAYLRHQTHPSLFLWYCLELWSCDPVVPSLILPLPASLCNHRMEFLRGDSVPHCCIWSRCLKFKLMVNTQMWIEFTLFCHFSEQGRIQKYSVLKGNCLLDSPLSLLGRDMYSSVIVAKLRGLVILTLTFEHFTVYKVVL